MPTESTRPLRYAESDAARVAAALKTQHAYDHGKQALLNDSVFARDALTVVDSIIEDTAPVDHLLLFFAGHGIVETTDSGAALFLGVHGTELADVEHSALPLQQLLERLREASARSCIIVLDCCFSGLIDSRSAMGLRYLADLRKGRRVKRPVPIIEGEGCLLIGASGANEFASESSIYKAGVLTHHLLGALYRHRDMRVLAVSTLVSELEMALHLASDGRQVPVMLGENHGASIPTILRLP